MKKKLLALLLALALIVCTFPAAAFAGSEKNSATKGNGTPYTFKDKNGYSYTIYTVTNLVQTGSKGKAVRLVQSLMNQFYYRTAIKNYYVGEIDGDFGPKTYTGVITFQANMGLGVDGIVGAMTWSTLHTRWKIDLKSCAMPGV